MENLLDLRISLQSALIGDVSSELLAVTASIDDTVIRVHFYFRDTVSEDDIERLQYVGTEVIADYPSPYMIEEKWFSVKEHLIVILDFLAFLHVDGEAYLKRD